MIFSPRPRHLLPIGLLVLASALPDITLDETLAGARVATQSLVDPVVQQAWLRAISNDQAAGLRRLIRLHEPATLLSITASNGKSALMVAGKVGDLPLVASLVSAGAQIDAKTQTNGTALMFAVLGNQKAVAQWLVARGADIHVIGSNGWTALTIAAAKGHLELLQWLMALGADAQVRDVYRYTPLMRAVENNHESVVRVFLSLPETDVNVQDEFDNTSLHHAVYAGNAAMVQLLLQHGASTTIVNRHGLTAVRLAEGNQAVLSLFR